MVKSNVGAAVLAAGEGRRLQPLTDYVPKPLVPIGNQPVLEAVLARLAAAGISHIALNAYHRAQELVHYVQRSAQAIHLSIEEKLLGTAGGLRQILTTASWSKEVDLVVVHNADVVFELDLQMMIDKHTASLADATLVVRKPDSPADPATVYLDEEGRVQGLLGGSPKAHWMGPYTFTGVHIASRHKLTELPQRGCLVRNFYQERLAAWDVRALVSGAAWSDIGTLQSYFQANMATVEGAALALGRQSLVAPDALIGRAANVHHACIGAGARVAEGVDVRRCVVWPGAHVGQDAQNAIITPFCHLQI